MAQTTECNRCGTKVTAGALFCMRCGADVSGGHDKATVASVKSGLSTTRAAREDLLQQLRSAALGEYEIFAELGSGGMATVFLAHDIQLDRKVAIKVMNPTLLLGEGMAERFKLEARTAAKLSHPHIIPIFAVKETDDLLYFVMKFVDGRPLDSIVKEVGPLPIPMVQTVVTKVGEALGYAHRQGVVHRDIKPANIMIDVEGMPVVTDFGIAKVADTQGLTMTGATIGTPTYMSPEQCTAEEITGASDQYSLGAVGYEMLTGKPPFQSDTAVTLMYMHCHDKAQPIVDLRPDCPPALAAAMERMLEKKPEDRWPTMEAALSRIGRHTLGYDDPVRTQMIDLAKAGENREVLRRVSTPRSPMPVSRVEGPVAASGPEVATDAETVKLASAPRSSIETKIGVKRRGKGWMVALAAVAIAVVGAGVVWLGPLSAGQDETAASGEQQAVAPSVATIALSPEESDINAGESLQIVANALDSSGVAVTNVNLSWDSDAPIVAAVSQAGLVTGLAEGTASIRVRGGGISASATIRVAEPQPEQPEDDRPTPPAAVATVSISNAPGAMSPGETAQLRATPRDANGAALPGRRTSWVSSNPAVANVSSAGRLTALAPGTATITAASGGKTQFVTITVQAEQVAGVSVLPTNPAGLDVGETIELSATALSDRGVELSDRTVSWASSDTRVAAVSDEGIVTAVGPGNAQIQAAVGGRTASVTITVYAPPQPLDEPEQPPPDPRPAIRAMIQSYARAIESQDIEQIKQVFPSLSADQQTDFEGSFRGMRDLKVTLVPGEPQINGQVAQVAVNATYDFYNTDSRRDESQSFSFELTLRQVSGAWQITASR
jgi:serine/threonine protein kinase